MTVKAHPEAYTGGAIIEIPLTGISNDTLYAGLEAFFSELSSMIDAGSMIIASLLADVSL